MSDKYTIDTPENKAFLSENARRLLEFGRHFPSPGGGSYYLGDDGTPWIERPRETWITCRMAHVYSMGAMLGHKGSGELADAALKIAVLFVCHLSSSFHIRAPQFGQ